MDSNEDAQKVLLHESDQLHANIQRNMSEMYQLLSLGFPVLTGAFAVAVDGKIDAQPNLGLIYTLFAILANLLIVSFNGVWMQLNSFTRYKYSQVLPKLYALSGRTGDNYGQDAVRRGLLRAMIGAVIVQAVLFPLGVIATYVVRTKYCDGPFAWAAYFAVLCAAVTIVMSWLSAYDGVSAVRRSLLVEGGG